MCVVAVFRKFVCVFVAGMVLALPLLACTLPGMQMSEEEMACCRHMADQCDDPSMPASHSCCTKTPSAQAGAFQTKQRDPASLETVGQVVVTAHLKPQSLPVAAVERSVFNLAESPPGYTSVLRI